MKLRGWMELGLRALAVLPLLAFAAVPSLSQGLDGLELKQNQSVEEYRRLSQEIAISEKRQEELAAEIAAMKNDGAAVTSAMIQAAKTERKLGEDVREIEFKLRNLAYEETDLRKSLISRRSTLAEVLAALQRMGLNPPPALLVRPEDALASVRSAILLGAVVPELRAETEMLFTDLRDLERIMASSRAEQQRLTAKRTEQAEEKQRLALLLQEKQRLQAEAEARMDEERAKAGELAGRAQTLQELIASLESEIEARREADSREDGRAAQGLPDSIPFPRRTGLLPLPASGQFAGRFGQDDGAGGTLKGDIVRTQSGAIVTAPADGTVLYAGPFRSYGQLLIVNPGDGYHIVLAGMDRLNVSLGQTVLAGEPVGMMGEARLASIAASTVGDAMPELYVEFRKDGKPVDPGPWWNRELTGRTGNDT